MNCSEAKKLSIVGYLASIGKQPENVKNNSVWYCSPFRQESKASFKVDRINNIWYDFGTGTGGNILDLVMQLNNTDITGALLILQRPELSKLTFSFSEQQNSDNSIKIKHIQKLQNRALIQYLESRCISYAKAERFINEAYYLVNGKQYFALAFKNDLGGFELRNKYFKGSSSPKGITTISGLNKTILNIFEGVADFLSCLEYYKTPKPAGDTIVLNSVNNLKEVLPDLQNYRKINLYLDNDTAGNQTADTIKRTHPAVIDYSKIIYTENKDMNEFWMQLKKHPVKTEC